MKTRALWMRRAFGWVALLLALLTLVPATGAGAQDEELPVTLYFFWGDGCPHCAAAKPFLDGLAQEHPGLTVAAYEVWNSEENRQLFAEMAAAHGFEPTGVPTFFLAGGYRVGFNDSIAADLEAAVAGCVVEGCEDAGAGVVPGAATAAPTPAAPPAAEPAGPQSLAEGVITLPFFGEVDAAHQSLALTTALIALVDGFNPCSLWVLSVLLALTLRTGSRRITVIIGLVFITVTALVYALFIAGLFTMFTAVSMAPWLRIAVALVALAFAAVNIKDYFWFQQGVSLTISAEKKPGIYRRMRAVLARTDSVPAMIGGTVVLAAGVSVVELACTAGFPVMWTNILTSQGASTLTFVTLLVLYMVIYQLDELAIFGTAVVTMRASKLEERHGRILKLGGGMLMLTLAAVMLIDPSWMNSIGTSLLVFAAAVAATALVLLLHRVVLPRMGIWIGSERSAKVASSERKALRS